jgi:hypothetical protein
MDINIDDLKVFLDLVKRRNNNIIKYDNLSEYPIINNTNISEDMETSTNDVETSTNDVETSTNDVETEVAIKKETTTPLTKKLPQVLSISAIDKKTVKKSRQLKNKSSIMTNIEDVSFKIMDTKKETIE